MSKLKLFELESDTTWWVASQDEHGVLSLIRDEMYNRDFDDLEIDSSLNDFEIKEITKYEAETIGITTTDGEISSLWYCFISNRREGVLGTSLDCDALELGGPDELNFDADEYV